MNQIVQNLNTGELKIEDVPLPLLKNNGVLVQTYFSVISAGTEKSTVNAAKSSLIGKAKQRPEQVKQVIEAVKKEGLIETYQKVKTKLDSPKPLGYSCAGKVIAVGKNVTDINVGDLVACGGGNYACHAEINYIPRHLVAKVPASVDIEEAAFSTIAAIALQGVRLLNAELGSKIAVIGTGLLGNIAIQLLNASGCKVIALDVSETALRELEEKQLSKTALITDPSVLKIVKNFSNGNGVDGVMITAATNSNQPVEIAGELCRKKGKVVVTGAVRMDIPRDNYYEKEIDVVISSSYGPGRYDKNYEELGIDYPYGYVRFTEGRNLETIINLLEYKKIDFKSLISHRFEIENAAEAYDVILGKTKERYKAIVLTYNQLNDYSDNSNKTVSINGLSGKNDKLGISFIGAGSFAQKYLLPNAALSNKVKFASVCTSTGISANHIGKKYNFVNITTDQDTVFNDEITDIVFIATRHGSHGQLVLQGIKSAKHIFVEKPLALKREELELIKKNYLLSNEKKHLLVGFNRRFSDFATRLELFTSNINEPLLMTYRINAGFIPKDHWIQNDIEGGGRIIGEICHFIDFSSFIIKSPVKSVYASSIQSNNSEITNFDTLSIVLNHENGSLTNIIYLANGDTSVSKERIEISGGNKFAILNDFKSLELTENGKTKRFKTGDKGHKNEISQFLKSILTDKPLIPFDELYETTLTTFDIVDSLLSGTIIKRD